MAGMNTMKRHRAPVQMYGCPTRSPRTIMDMTSEDRTQSNTVAVTVIIAAAVDTVAIIGAAVTLSLTGSASGDIMALIGSVIGAAAVMAVTLGQLVGMRRTQDEQGEKLDRVVHQTNGGLNAIVDGAVSRALDKHLGDRTGP